MQHYSLNQPLPETLSVREALDVYLSENGFTTEEYDLDVVKVTFWGFTFSVPNPPSRKLAVRFHDLHHLMTGYGTDPTGEAEISAWELRKGIHVFGIYVQLIIFFGTLLGMIHSPRKVWRAWNALKSSARLPSVSMERYEHLLMLNLGELRALYGVPSAGIPGRRTLNENAPSRPNDPDESNLT
jgi:hypothetical protein